MSTPVQERKIRKILVANRGEIAVRVMRSAREMGIATVAVYSEADRHAQHVKYADEAVCIGPAASSESYLVMDKIIAACHETGADAIHPGYGFLSENATFAQRVADAGLIFIGPSAHSIEVMGSKLGAKAAARQFGIPMVPGTPDAVTDVNEAIRIAGEIGYPVLIKASAGGGGKGMRLVNAAEELEEQMQRAISEAKSAFGDGAVFIEKFILNPKHIEIQVLGDQHGHIVHLFERECSVQRRHQKVVEEAPSAVLTPAVRAAMGKAAVDAARSCNYYGAGTVEFVVDTELNFYFLEMNTRLQVEHPVTEAITGLDLVKEQIKIAEGKRLDFTQEEVQMRGHAIEVRVYAEDPASGFLPDIGTLATYRPPSGPGIRVDDGYRENDEIPVYYDPLIAKLVTYGENRETAISRMVRAIDDYQITGIQTTLGFCKFVMQHPAFKSGTFDTGFVGKYFTPEMLQSQVTEEEAQVLAALAIGLVDEAAPALPTSSGTVAERNAPNSRGWKARALKR